MLLRGLYRLDPVDAASRMVRYAERMRTPCAACVPLLASIAIAAAGAQTSSEITNPAAILVSRQLAARAQIAVGDVVTLAADPEGVRRAAFRVSGVYEPTPDPMRFTAPRIEARMHLPDLIDLVADPADPGSPESISSLNVRLADPGEARAFASELAARAPGAVARSTTSAREDDPFKVLERFHVAISAVTMVAGTAFLLALMVIRAEERRETVGILRLVGISRRTLLLSVGIEGVLIECGADGRATSCVAVRVPAR